MKFKAELSKFLSNKWVLNIVVLLSTLNVIGYLILNNINAVAAFIVIGLLISYFSKNMIVILGVPLILVNLIVMNKVRFEGFETNKNSQEDAKTNKSVSNKPNELKKKELKPIKKTPQGLSRTTIDSDTALNSTIDTSDNTQPDVNIASNTTDESFEVGRAKRGGGYDIDYASTVEDAYDELNKILGSDGIKKLTGDTQNLVKQQLQLAEAMNGMGPLIKSMAPLMQQAQGILGSMGDKEGLGNIMDMAKKLTGGMKQ